MKRGDEMVESEKQDKAEKSGRGDVTLCETAQALHGPQPSPAPEKEDDKTLKLIFGISLLFFGFSFATLGHDTSNNGIIVIGIILEIVGIILVLD